MNALQAARKSWEAGTAQQMLLFFFTGAMNTALSYGIFLLFYLLFFSGSSYVLSAGIATTITLVTGFLSSRRFVFNASGHQTSARQIASHLVGAISIYALNASLLIALVEYLGIAPEIAQLLVSPVIALTSYFWQKLVTFGVMTNSPRGG